MARSAGKLEIPPRIAIIMDGNGRWATQKNLPRTAGHRESENAITDVVRASVDLGLEALALFAFSTENWKRPKEEVSFLMQYNKHLLDLRVDEFHAKNVKIRYVGRRRRIPKFLLNKMDETMELTRHNTGLKLNVCYNYGGRAELVDAMKAIGEEVASGKLKPSSITEKTIARHLYAPDVAEYDVMIRTASEMRISNFLLWELAYAELVFLPVLWPDFRRQHLMEAIEEYNRRTRKFGAIADG